MKTITIVFSKPQNMKLPIGSWIIRKWMKTDYSHVSVHFFSQSLDRHLIYEAVGSGVRFVGKDLWDKHAVAVYSTELNVTEEQYVKVLQRCVDLAGIKYGLTQNIGICIAKILKLIKNPFKSAKSEENCSEIAAEVLTILGISFDKHLDLITPKDIFDKLN